MQDKLRESEENEISTVDPDARLSDKFIYDKERDLYICPEGQELYKIKHRTENPKNIKYRNYEACQECENKELCTTAKKGRIITRILIEKSRSE